jgi:hypothetical protein
MLITQGDRTMRKPVWVLSVLLVGLGVLAGRLWQQMDAGRQQIAELQGRLDRVPLVPATTSSVQLLAAAESDQAEDATAPTLARSLGMPAATTTAAIEERTAQIKAVMATPERQELAHARIRAQMPIQYPELGKVLSLTQEKVNQLFDLLAKQEAEKMHDFNSRPNGEEKSIQEFGRRLQEEEAQLMSLLGVKYPEWQQYKRELPTRKEIRDLNAVLDSAGIPMSEAQAASLMSVITGVQKQIDQESLASASQGTQQPLPSRYNPERTRRLLESASSSLTPQQLEAYQQMLERQKGRSMFSRGTGGGQN